MMRLLLTIIKTDFQHDYNTGLDEADFLCFITNKNNDNKHYVDDKKIDYSVDNDRKEIIDDILCNRK